MKTRIMVEFGNEKFILGEHLRAAEMAMVTEWTGHRNRQEWFDAVGEEDVGALRAALLIYRKRNGDTTSKFADVDFDFDELRAYFIDEDGAEIEPDLDPATGLPRTHDDGSWRWVYTDGRKAVPHRPTKRRQTPSAT